MSIMSSPILQVALDLLEIDRALQIAEESVTGGCDWIEAGTPLIKSEGMAAVSRLRERFPDRTIVADMKIADTGWTEVEMAAKSGASVVCVLGGADDSVIIEAVRAAGKFGVKIMADLINVPDPAGRARELAVLSVDIINVHVGIDQQMAGKSSLDYISSIRDATSLQIAVAGGLDAESAAEAVRAGASIVIVGGWITKSADVTGSSRKIRDAIDRPAGYTVQKKDPEIEIREILNLVSAPNVTDAMHRKGAMFGIVPLGPDLKAVGKALTVQTIAGDWAKPVEAIDMAGPGDVLVINNDGGTHVAPWGELATLSCINRGIAGVVIDGAVRDVDDIRKMHYPLWASATVPNAGEPKGFGEIGTEILCCGQTVRTGDWIIADESGVVVIPKERAYEIARRALEVRKTEMRIDPRQHRTVAQL